MFMIESQFHQKPILFAIMESLGLRASDLFQGPFESLRRQCPQGSVPCLSKGAWPCIALGKRTHHLWVPPKPRPVSGGTSQTTYHLTRGLVRPRSPPAQPPSSAGSWIAACGSAQDPSKDPVLPTNVPSVGLLLLMLTGVGG